MITLHSPQTIPDSPQTIPGNDDAEDSNFGENSTEDTPSPLFYGRKTNDPT